MVASAEFDELVRASSLLSREHDFDDLVTVLVEQSIDISYSDLACLYLFPNEATKDQPLFLAHRRGSIYAPKSLPRIGETVDFICESGEAVVVLEPRDPYFPDIYLSPALQSAVALPVFTPSAKIGILFAGSRLRRFYGRDRLQFLEAFTRLAAGMLHNSELYEQLREKLRQVESLERYQEGVFSSMTNLLVTTDRSGAIAYFNDAASKRLGLDESSIGREFVSQFESALDRRILSAVESAVGEGSELLGVEGIYTRESGSLDFALNISPLKGKRGGREGATLLFTDQTAERELKNRVDVAVEERRVIKDMFTRYLSTEVVETLMEYPDQVRPGGAKKNATIFFADIRGYTPFSEGKQPEYIIEVLNEYFSVAVEVIVRYHGFIDKFIGDAIMAAWGVPMTSEVEDARNAVAAALEIQQLISARDRTFFTGDAKNLRVGIGMHTGPLVAGNLGSAQRMDYSVIGDTVNVAARLEGVAAGGEVIITQDTRRLVGDAFAVEEREPVRVKGKQKPIPIFSVLEKAS